VPYLSACGWCFKKRRYIKCTRALTFTFRPTCIPKNVTALVPLLRPKDPIRLRSIVVRVIFAAEDGDMSWSLNFEV